MNYSTYRIRLNYITFLRFSDILLFAGRIFPKLRKKLSSSDKVVKATMPTSDADIDYVFRIVLAYKPKSLRKEISIFIREYCGRNMILSLSIVKGIYSVLPMQCVIAGTLARLAMC